MNRLLLTPIPVANPHVRSNAESPCIPDCAHSEDSGSGSLEIGELLKFLAKPTRILRRMPCLSQPSAARKLAAIIEQVVSRNDVPSWARLFQFPRRCLRCPQQGGRQWTLASSVSKQVSKENGDPDELYSIRSYGRPPKSRKSMEALAIRVSSKLEEGDYRGAVRLACSRATITEQSPSTIEAMNLKHPPQYSNSIIEDQPHPAPLGFTVNEELIRRAIMLFPSGSSEGTDGLLPQHLKDLIGPAAENGAVS